MRRPPRHPRKAMGQTRHASWAEARPPVLSQSRPKSNSMRRQPFAQRRAQPRIPPPSAPNRCWCQCWCWCYCSWSVLGLVLVPVLEQVLVLLTPAWCCSSCWRRLVWYASVLVCLTRRRAADEGSKESEHGSFFFFAERGTLFASSLSTTLSTKSCRSPQKSLSRDSLHDAQVFRSASR